MAFDVEMPDGTIIAEVPEGTSKDVIFQKWQQSKQRVTTYDTDKEVGLVAPQSASAMQLKYYDDTQNLGKDKNKYVGYYETDTSFAEDVISTLAAPTEFGSEAVGSAIRLGIRGLYGLSEKGAEVESFIGRQFGVETPIADAVVVRSREVRSGLTALEQKIQKKAEEKLGSVGKDIAGGVGSLGLVLSTGGAGLVLIWGDTRATINEEARKSGKSDVSAGVIGDVVATGEAALEAINVGRILKIVEKTGSPLLKRVIKGGITESLTEGAQGLQEEVITQVTDVRDRPVSDAAKDILYQAMIGAVVGGGVSGGVSVYQDQQAINTIAEEYGISKQEAKDLLVELSEAGDMVADISETQITKLLEDPEYLNNTLDVAAALQNSDYDTVLNLLEQNGELTPEAEASIKEMQKQEVFINTELANVEPELMQEYQEVLQSPDVGFLGKLYKAGKETVKQVGRGIEMGLATTSGTLKRISPKLKPKLRNYEFQRREYSAEKERVLVPLFEQVSKLPAEARSVLDHAMINGDSTVVESISKKYNLEGEFKKLRDILDNIQKDLNDNGIKTEYREGYFPRVVKDSEGLMAYLRNSPDWSIFQSLIQRASEEKGRVLSDNEAADIVTNFLSNNPEPRTSNVQFGQTKQRTVGRVNSEMKQFYLASDQAILSYLESASQAIAVAKFLGKKNVAELDGDIEASIGKYINDGLASGEITPAQADKLAGVLRDAFRPARINGAVSAFKNTTYALTMGQVSSAITQVGDLFLGAYRNGIYNTALGFGAVVAGKKKVSITDINVENILQEFQDRTISSDLLNKVFTYNGLRLVDRIGKETLINAALKKYTKLAKNPTQEFNDFLDYVFGEKAESVAKDLREGKVSTNVRELLFYELLEIQPVANSEMPQAYLRYPNGRILYMLKSYTLKVLNIYRDDVIANLRTNPVKAANNFVRLTSLLMAGWMTAEEIKEWIFGNGRNLTLSDRSVMALLAIAGFNEYDLMEQKTRGTARMVINKAVPPTTLFDSIEDVIEQDKKGIKRIPVIGKPVYQWFGMDESGDKKKDDTVDF